ncbi:hypothetical protein [Nocardioides speluncae]|uniref:hypothetical protein n=1 Tax=Nocardioides speluncae TaxID=2670337 RepID=UPI000D694582|nr:hypothetical protein [Nocardioides speluncae]
MNLAEGSGALRVVAFVVGLAAVLVAGLGVGRLVGPIDEPEPKAHEEEHAPAAADPESEGHGDHQAEPEPEVPASQAITVGGLNTSEKGYSLRLAKNTLPAGKAQGLAFTILGEDGRPVTAYDVEHERRLHLIVVRRDLTGYQHLHPTLDQATGRWTTKAELRPGAWRVLADFHPTGADKLALGADLFVAGKFQPEALGKPSRSYRVDGYQVSLTGELKPGESPLTVKISKRGKPVKDLQPYLGAFGHMVVLRAGDLGYAHVHSDADAASGAAGPDVLFHAEIPSADLYRIFVEFRHGGVVRTAVFTLPAADVSQPSESTGEAGHDH